MKKFMSKAFAVIMSATLILGITACGNSSSGSSSSESTTEASVENTTESESTGTFVANPVLEVGEDEMVEQTGIDLPAPEGATDVKYSIIQQDSLCIAQLDYTLDGQKFYLRAESTDLAELIAKDDDGNFVEDIDYSTGDISGLNYEWTESGTNTVKDCEAIFNIYDGENNPGYIAWLDTNSGVLYNLCMTENADIDILQTNAEKVFVPVESDFAPEESTTEE